DVGDAGQMLVLRHQFGPRRHHHAVRPRRRTGVNTLVGLEALRMGVEGKALLWRSLLAVAVHDTRLRTDRLAELLERAGQQLTTLDSLHSRAASALISAEGPV
ncbi:hypothetical protein ACWEWX_53325, partial [Streptomyces asiaticus]